MQKYLKIILASCSLAIGIAPSYADPQLPANAEQDLSKAKTPSISKTSTKLWNLQQADIRSVIEAVSKTTHKNFLIDSRVQGKISIVSSKPINSDELYQVFLSMLQVAGYAAIPSGKVVKIVPNIDARSISPLPVQSLNRSEGDDMVVHVVTIKYVSAEQLVPVIRPLMPQWSNVSSYGPSNSLILSGRAANIHRLVEIIEKVDTPNTNGIDAVSLDHALAMDVVSTIKALLDNQKNRSYQRNITLAADDQSNTILISGSQTERLRIRLLINKLDSKKAYNGDNTEVVYLKFLKAQDLIPILSGVAKANFSGNVGTTVGSITLPVLDTSTPTNGVGTGADSDNTQVSTLPQANNASIASNTQASSESSESNSKPKVQIIAEPNTNAIILSAPNALLRTLKGIITKLDTRPSQVMVEAMITEINEDDINHLGFEWGMVNNNTFKPGFAIISSHMSINNFQAQLNALVRMNKANILSTPSVVVLDNRQAKILIGKQISIQESTNPNTVNGGNPYTTFTRKNVALHLYVKPQISQGNSIQLQIDHGNDTLQNEDSEAVVNGTPVINTSNIQTSVLVNSGDVLVLGGLIQNGRRQVGNKIPILGDIPGLGELFQNNARGKSKKVLMVFIRPIILNTNKKELQVTNSKYFNLRDEQLEMMREEPYSEDNKDMILKPLKKRLSLPKPFHQQSAKSA